MAPPTLPDLHLYLPSPHPTHAFDQVLKGLVRREEGEHIVQICVSADNKDHHQDLGTLLLDSEPLDHPPPFVFTNVPSCHVTLRLDQEKERFGVERVILDGVILPPDPESVIIFYYDYEDFRRAAYLRSLPELQTGVPTIVSDLYANEQRIEWSPFGSLYPTAYEELKQGDGIISKLSSRSLGIKQFRLRLSLILNVLNGRFRFLSLSNFVLLLALDLVLGTVMSHFLNSYSDLYSSLHLQAQQLLTFLLKLLEWLSGSPAGLKLNAALNTLLSRFFAYHLHLWANYIGILEPILSFLLSSIILVGPIFGISLQFSLMKDLVSMSTFHIYCLYIYAARLYHVLIISIPSLGRIFLGRKWNPLRQRVDHVQLNLSEIFLGALLFTISIFLAPTVILYYFVFLLLRLPVLLSEWILYNLVISINGIRLGTLTALLCKWAPICEKMYLERIADSPAQFNMRLQSNLKLLGLVIQLGGWDKRSFGAGIKNALKGEVLGR